MAPPAPSGEGHGPALRERRSRLNGDIHEKRPTGLEMRPVLGAYFSVVVGALALVIAGPRPAFAAPWPQLAEITSTAVPTPTAQPAEAPFPLPSTPFPPPGPPALVPPST